MNDVKSEIKRMARTVSTTQLIEQRARENSKPQKRNDPYRLGLAIEGGGMRGVVAGGMVSGLEELGLRDVFDVVCGTSAGAASAAYFVAGQAKLGTSIFYEDINNEKFIDLWNLCRGRPIMSVDFLIDEVFKRSKPLDWEVLEDCPIELNIVTTDIDRGDYVALKEFGGNDNIFEALRASARIPLIAGPPVVIRGKRMMDGGLVQPIPVEPAIQAGCTHILVLLTRPPAVLRGQPRLIDHVFLGPLMAMRFGRKVQQMYLNRPRLYKRVIEDLQRRTSDSTSWPRIDFIQLPASTAEIDRLEKSHEILVAGARNAMKAVFRRFEFAGGNITSPEPYFSAGADHRRS